MRHGITSWVEKRRYRFALIPGLAVFLACSGRDAGAAHATARKTKKLVALAQNSSMWRVRFVKSARGYHVVSVTNLRGQAPSQAPSAEIAFGSFKGWNWKVEADPSLLPSWKTWQNYKVAQRAARLPADDWSYPAMDWNRAFQRAYRLASYLLGRKPLPLDAAVILVPEGSAYHQRFDQRSDSAVPLTLGFYYPAGTSSSRADQYERFSAMIISITRVAREYERILVAAGAIEPMGKGEAARRVNQEGQGVCWYESTFLTLAAGTHFVSWLHWSQQSSAERLAHYPPTGIKLSDARYWGALREAESISWYFEVRGLKNRTFSAKDPAAMNAVLSVCRAMTQHPHDLTKGAYPASQVEYVPFFTAPAKSRSGGKK